MTGTFKGRRLVWAFCALAFLVLIGGLAGYALRPAPLPTNGTDTQIPDARVPREDPSPVPAPAEVSEDPTAGSDAPTPEHQVGQVQDGHRPPPPPEPPPEIIQRPPAQTEEGESIPPSLQSPPELSQQVETIHRDVVALARVFSSLLR